MLARAIHLPSPEAFESEEGKEHDINMENNNKQQQQQEGTSLEVEGGKVEEEVVPGKGAKEDEYLEIVRKLRLDLADKSNECEMLKIKLEESDRYVGDLSQELDKCKLTIFESNEDSKKIHEEMVKSKKLKEDYVRLMSDFMDLGELSNSYRQNLVDQYLAKSNAINNLECFVTSGVIEKELEECRLRLDRRVADLNLTLAKLRNLEEENAMKDKNINELKKTLDDAKVTHKHEITVLEEYIQCLKNTITSYEKTLTNYIEPKPLADSDSHAVVGEQ